MSKPYFATFGKKNYQILWVDVCKGIQLPKLKTGNHYSKNYASKLEGNKRSILIKHVKPIW